METLALTPADTQRFWAKVDKSGDCWIWKGESDREGYGRFVKAGRRIGAHRVSLALSTNRVEPTLFVLHSCDNPPCVNPAHLRYGTHVENMKDMTSRNRGASVSRMRGEGNHHAKLTASEVLAIRAELAAGVRNRDIVKRYGISAQTVSNIRSRTTWRHLEGSTEAAA